MSYQTRSNCLACGGQTFGTVANFGQQAVVDFIETPESEILTAPLVIGRCLNCNTVQLMHTVHPDRLYTKFWYRSHINEGMRAALKDVAVSAWKSLGVSSDGAVNVLDIGCNDGTLLGNYPEKFKTVGVDPARELVKEAVDEGRVDVAVCGYFSKEAVQDFGPYMIITAVAMFYDLEEPKKFLEDCKAVLDPKGILVVQQNYLGTMLEDTAFDNICHEHLAYYSVTTFSELVKQAGLEIQGVELNAVNGGSFRAYITYPGRQLQGFIMEKQVGVYANYLRLQSQEYTNGLHTDAPYVAFNERVTGYCAALREFILSKNGDVMVYGASTRGSTLLQTLNLPFGAISYAAERDVHKVGRYTAGTNLRIVTEEWAREHTKNFFVLPWHFMETIKRREDQWLARGGTFIIPLPVPRTETDEEVVPLVTEVRK
jgi:SAM-dependent methyltransferase